MKQVALFVIIAVFSISPLLAQTADQSPERTPAASDVEELRSASRLPEAAKEAREAGTEEDEIQNVVKGVQEKKLSTEEGVNTIRIMEENSADGASNKGISDFVAEQKAKGVHGEELGQTVRTELQSRHRVRVEEGKGTGERKEERTGQEAEVQRESGEKAKSEAKAADPGQTQGQKGKKKKPIEERPESESEEKTTK